jgi:cellulose synthase/poly-beta-1,6-N-acetylglucosamine synthase-like glycosyltransferase
VGTIATLLNFAYIFWLLRPSNISSAHGPFLRGVAIASFVIMVTIEIIRILQSLTLWLFAAKAKDPVGMEPAHNLRVAILTTIVPSKEPIELVRATLVAMKQIRYNGLVDVWILDEGNDPEVLLMAEQIGVKHFSRKGIEVYNQQSGEFKTKTKAGNHNSWRAEHEHEYDIVAQMDPDHVPLPNFLERTLGYFRDPNIAFVVAPQVYGNQDDRWLTRASASQAYIFHGIIQRGGNGYGSPLLIGTNHLYRPYAWAQIGGYQDSIIEDHLTSMKLHGAVNPYTGKKWRSVYTPDIISVGEGPTSWTDYFNQQKRWAYGVWEIVIKHAKSLRKNLSFGQKITYIALQFFYPSVAVVWILGGVISAVYFLLGVSSIQVDTLDWFFFWSLSLMLQIGIFIWLNRFNLTSHERKHGGMDAMLLTILTAPVYAAAGIAALARRPLAYAVTAKGNLSSPDSPATYKPQIIWAFITETVLLIGVFSGKVYPTQIVWQGFTLIVTLLPLLAFIWRDNIQLFAKHFSKKPLGFKLPASTTKLNEEIFENAI